MNLEGLFIKLSLDLSEFKKGLKDAKSESEKTTEDIVKTTNKVGEAIGKSIAMPFKILGKSVATPIKAMTNMVKSAASKIKGMFEQAFTFGILSKAFTSFGETITKYIGNNSALLESLSKLKASLLTMVAPLLDIIIPAFQKLINVITSAVNKIAQFTATLTGKTTKATLEQAKALEKLGSANKAAGFDELNTLGSSSNVSADFSDLENAESEQLSFLGLFKAGVEGATNLITGLFSKITTLMPDAFATVKGALEELPTLLNGILNIDWGQFASNLFSGLVEVVNGIASIIRDLDWGALVSDIFDIIGAWFETLFSARTNETIGKLTSSLLAAALTSVGTILSEIWTSIKTSIEEIKEKGFKKWITDLLASVGEWIVSYFKGFWDGLPDSYKQALIDFVEAFKLGWKTIGDFAIKVFTNIKDFFKGIVNTIIGFINSLINKFVDAINTVINAINKLSFKMPDWLGGKSFGFNIGTITAKNIPLLATGGIITQPTNAIVGESGTEAVLPLETNTGWMDKLADKFAERLSSQPEKIVLNVDGRQLGWATINNINSITKQTGNLQLALR